MKDDKKVKCPHCLGEGIEYDPEEDDVILCHLCKGSTIVEQEEADNYNPLKELEI